jgi:hypothetical protein
LGIFTHTPRRHRNVELMWLLGRLVPDHKTVAELRNDNGCAIRA